MADLTEENAVYRDEFMTFLRDPEIENAVPYVYDDKDREWPRRRVTPGSRVRGNRTIGIGVNLDGRSDGRDLLTAIGADYDKVIAGTEDLTVDQMNMLAALVANERVERLRRQFKHDLDKISRDQWTALLSLAYNSRLGPDGFPTLIGPGLMQAVRERDDKSAIWEIVCNSKGRAVRRKREAARYAGFGDDVTKIDPDCTKGRPTALKDSR